MLFFTFLNKESSKFRQQIYFFSIWKETLERKILSLTHHNISISQFLCMFFTFQLIDSSLSSAFKEIIRDIFPLLKLIFSFVWDWTLSTSDNKMIIRLVYIFFSLYIKSFRNKFTKLYCSRKKQSFDQLNRFLFKFSWAALVNFRRKLWIRYYLFS